MAKKRTEIIFAVKRYAAELERLGVPVDQIILYGSYRRGRAGEDSDIDLAVFSEAFGPPKHREFSGVLSEAKWNTEPMIEAIGFHPLKLQTSSRISFLGEILRTGKIIYRRNSKTKNRCPRIG
ncbi:MAG: nucleotidyltransferase domain-containing protein [Phycisphaerae bacterium]